MKNRPNKQWFAKVPGFEQLKISLLAYPPTRLLSYFTLLLLCSLPVAAVLGQTDTCYVMKQDASGFDVASRWPALNAKACELVAAFDSTDYADSFKVFGFGFYAELEYYDGYSYPQVFLDMKAEVEQESPYYLLIGRQSDRTGIFTRFWVEVKLPEGGNFECLIQIERTLLNTGLKVQMNQFYQQLGKDPYSFSQVELISMDTLIQFVEKQIVCCPNTGNRSGECFPCPTAEQIKTFFLDRNFEQSEIEIQPGQLSSARPDDGLRNNVPVVNYANKLYNQQYLILNPEQFLLIEIQRALDDGINAKAYITNNDNFCDPTISLEIDNNFEISGLDAAIHVHLWENPDTNASDLLFVKFYTIYDDTLPADLPLVVVTAPVFSCSSYPLPSFCPPNQYAVAKNPSNSIYYGYHCNGSYWVISDSVEYNIRSEGDPANQRGYADGAAKNLAKVESFGIIVNPDGSEYEQIAYIPSWAAYRRAVGEPEKFPTIELEKQFRKKVLKGFWGFGPGGTTYEDEAHAIMNHFVYNLGNTLLWNCESEISSGLSQLDEIQSELNTIEGIFEDWLTTHDNFDTLFTPVYRIEKFTQSFGNTGPNLSSFPFGFGPGWAGVLFGGTQGRQVEVRKFNKYIDCFDIEIMYTIYDTFGVGDEDGGRWFSSGLIAFWVLQHYRNFDGSCNQKPCYVPITNHSSEIIKKFIICRE